MTAHKTLTSALSNIEARYHDAKLDREHKLQRVLHELEETHRSELESLQQAFDDAGRACRFPTSRSVDAATRIAPPCRCGHWFHTECLAKMGGFCRGCSQSTQVGWQGMVDDANTRIDKKLGEYWRAVESAGRADQVQIDTSGLEAGGGDEDGGPEAEVAAAEARKGIMSLLYFQIVQDADARKKEFIEEAEKRLATE